MRPGITIQIKDDSLHVMSLGGLSKKPTYLTMYNFTLKRDGVLEGFLHQFNTLEYALRDADYVFQWRD